MRFIMVLKIDTGGIFMLSKKTADAIVGLIALLAVTAFMLIGFTVGYWQYAWLVFLLIPVSAILLGMLTQEKKDLAGQLTGLVALLAVIAYMIMGFAFSLWHPGWLVFMAIPIAGSVAGLFKKEEKDGDSQDQKPEDK